MPVPRNLVGDERVEFTVEPESLEAALRRFSSESRASPKLWADYLLAVAMQSGAVLVTFDHALTRRASHSLLLH